MIAAGETELNLVVCSGSTSDQNSVDRINGVKRAVDEYADKGAKIVTDLDTDWDPDWLESNLPSTMRANPDANCIYIASDFLLPAAKAALQSTNQWIKTEKRDISGLLQQMYTRKDWMQSAKDTLMQIH